MTEEQERTLERQKEGMDLLEGWQREQERNSGLFIEKFEIEIA